MTIEIDGDTIIPDPDLAKDWNTTTRTLRRYELEPDGLPFVMLSGKKYRPVRACQEWLAKRIRHPNPTRQGRRGA